MTDTLMEFYNASNTIANLISGVQILSTDANHKAVIKDMQISNSSMPLRLKVNGSVVANISAGSLSRASGSEIIDSNSVVTLETAAKILFNSMLSVVDSGNVKRILFPSLIDSWKSYGSTSVTTTSISPAFTQTPTRIYQAPNGDILYSYYDGADKLKKRAGGLNGTETIIGGSPYNTFGTLSCSDSINIYGYDANYGNVTWYNLITGVTTSPIKVSGASASYASMAAVDGFVFIRPSYNQPPTIINSANNAYASLSNAYGVSATCYQTGFGKNSAGEYVAVTTTGSPSASINWYNFGTLTSASTNFPYTTGSANPTINSPNIGGSYGTPIIHNVPGLDNYLLFIPVNSGKIQFLNLTTFAIDFEMDPNSNISYANAKFIQAVNNTKVLADFPSAKIRATGVLVS